MGYCIYTIDTETTGLDPEVCEIVELSLSRLKPDEEGYIRQQETFFIQALRPESIQDEALKLNGHKREDILHQTTEGKEQYRHPSEVIKKLDAFIMDDDVSSADRIFYGMNPMFDFNFLTNFYKCFGSIDSMPFNCNKGNRILDLKQVVLFFDVCMGRRRKGYNLTNVAKVLGTKKEKSHRADADVRMTEASLLKMVEMVAPAVKENFSDCYSSDDVL